MQVLKLIEKCQSNMANIVGADEITFILFKDGPESLTQQLHDDVWVGRDFFLLVIIFLFRACNFWILLSFLDIYDLELSASVNFGEVKCALVIFFGV